MAIARVLAGDPKLILADEPTGNLDSLMAREIMDLLERINEQGTTIVMVTHSPSARPARSARSTCSTARCSTPTPSSSPSATLPSLAAAIQ